MEIYVSLIVEYSMIGYIKINWIILTSSSGYLFLPILENPTCFPASSPPIDQRWRLIMKNLIENID